MIFFLANFLFVDTVSEDAKVVATVLITVLVMVFFVIVVVAFVILLREERDLGPLRVLLREAHVRGLDAKQVIRDWRIRRAQKHNLEPSGAAVHEPASLNAPASAVYSNAAVVRGTSDDVLDLTAVPDSGSWKATLDEARTSAYTSNGGSNAAAPDTIEAAYGSPGVVMNQNNELGPGIDAAHLTLVRDAQKSPLQFV